MFKCKVVRLLKTILGAILRVEGKIDQMPTREEFDAALAGLGDKIAAAADRVQAAIAALQAKVDAGQDFTSELATLTAEGEALDNIQPPAAP